MRRVAPSIECELRIQLSLWNALERTQLRSRPRNLELHLSALPGSAPATAKLAASSEWRWWLGSRWWLRRLDANDMESNWSGLRVYSAVDGSLIH